MVSKSKLRLAFAADKGIDFGKMKQLKKRKEALKRKKHQSFGVEDGESFHSESKPGMSEDEQSERGTPERLINLGAVDESDTSESSIELDDRTSQKSKFTSVPDTGSDDEQEEREDIPVSDLEDLEEEEREDLVPHSRLTINNTSALIIALDRISILKDASAPFVSHQSIVSSIDTADSIPDVSDDLQRELAFYSQCLEAARLGRSRLIAEGVPFARPKDYFAEMVKEDAHMEKIKAKLVDEASAKKASAEARKLRDLKKFGKQVQIAKLQERQQAKRETLEKIKTLKRKRQETAGNLGTHEADVFDVAVDSEITPKSRSDSTGRPVGPHQQNQKRQKKNEKYGFGGKKRHAKSGDALSSGDLSSFNVKKMKVGGRSNSNKATTRPGKNKRKTLASK